MNTNTNIIDVYGILYPLMIKQRNTGHVNEIKFMNSKYKLDLNEITFTKSEHIQLDLKQDIQED